MMFFSESKSAESAMLHVFLQDRRIQDFSIGGGFVDVPTSTVPMLPEFFNNSEQVRNEYKTRVMK